MSLTAAKCTQCGANLEVDSAQEAAICNFCRTPFIVEKAINNYNIENAQINAQTVNVYNNATSDFMIEKGVLKEYNGSEKEVIIPDTVIIIGDYAFRDCITVKSVIMPDSVTVVADVAFAGCVNL